MTQPHDDITALLERVATGDQAAEGAFFDKVYADLHRMAIASWRNVPPSDTLQPTALVHEAYARLFGRTTPAFENRRHFFMAASRAMHDIIVEQARRHGAIKRGGHLKRVLFTDTAAAEIAAQAHEFLLLDEVIAKLKLEHPSAAEVVMLRVFGGLEHKQIAEISGCAEVTIRRRWSFAKAWLRQELDPKDL